jgi:hypothetical protein
MLRRALRDLAAAAIGAAIALLVVFLSEASLRHRAKVSIEPPDGPGQLVAWSLRHGRGEVELLAGSGSGLKPCRLPDDGRLRPLLDGRTKLPTRVPNWVADGPPLYLMTLEQGFEAGLPPRSYRIAFDAEPCPSGRVLVAAETILNFLYQRSVRETGEAQ